MQKKELWLILAIALVLLLIGGGVFFLKSPKPAPLVQPTNFQEEETVITPNPEQKVIENESPESVSPVSNEVIEEEEVIE